MKREKTLPCSYNCILVKQDMGRIKVSCFAYNECYSLQLIRMRMEFAMQCTKR